MAKLISDDFDKNVVPESSALKTVARATSENSRGKEGESSEIDRLTKLLEKREFELNEIKQKQVAQLQEMDRIAKYLIKRDLELSETRERREKDFQQLEERTKALDDSRKALMNILEDVEEARVQAEQERDKTSAVITNFADGLLVFDRDKRLSLINPQAEIFFKIKAKEIVGSPILELTRFAGLRVLVNLLGVQIKGIFRKELTVSENLTLEASAIPMMAGEEELGTLVILHDISREKMVEKIKTEFLSLAAHQLRTPLSAIKWTLRMLLDGDLGEITPEQRNLIEKTYLSNERMIALINELLDVTRIEEGRYLYNLIFAQLEDITQFVINSYKEELKRRGLNLRFDKPKQKLPQAKVDVEKIRLAIQNLLDNAVRYSPGGGQIIIVLGERDGQIEFKIQDQGIGIPKDQHSRVFEKFFRGANAARIETQGSGFGLFITKNIIEAHGGRIWFESEQGKGATFHFVLPAKESDGGFA